MSRLLFLIIFSLPVLASAGPKLVIFTVHGFLGDETTFCDLNSILQEDYGDQVAIKNIVYPSLDALRALDEGLIDNRDIRDYTKLVHKEMADFYRTNSIDPSTPFAFIGHSQGGIIGLRYVADCIYGSQAYCSQYLSPKNIKYFITMATPFWGSTTASRLKILDFIHGLLPMQQLKDLSMGSSIVTYNREVSLEPLLKNNHNIFPKDTEVISISADMTKSFLGKIFRIGTDEDDNRLLEHDMVVPVFSANIDYHFRIYPEKEDGYSIFGKTNMGSYYYPVHGFHAEYGFVEGIACVKRQRDEERFYRDNTIYLILRKHFDKALTSKNPQIAEKLKDPSRFVNDLQTFNMEVKFNLPQKGTWFRRVYFLKKHIEAYSEDPLIVDLSRRDSLLFHAFRGFNYDYSNSDLNYVTYYHTAFFDRGYFSLGLDDDFNVRYQNPYTAMFSLVVNMPWFEKVELSAPVSPAHSTFIEYDLKPIKKRILPFRLNNDFNRETHDGNQIIAIQSNPLSTKVFQFNRESKRGSVELRSLPKKNWLAALPAKSKKGFEQIHNECYIATVSSARYGKEIFYLGFYDEEPTRLFDGAGDDLRYYHRFRVIGRFAEGSYSAKTDLYERDRVLVTNPKLLRDARHVSLGDLAPDQYLRTGYFWINTDSVRLIEPCSTANSQQE